MAERKRLWLLLFTAFFGGLSILRAQPVSPQIFASPGVIPPATQAAAVTPTSPGTSSSPAGLAAPGASPAPMDSTPIPAPTTPFPTPSASPASTPTPKTAKPFWLEISPGYSVAALGDLASGAATWNSLLSQAAETGTAGFSSAGYFLGGELGLNLDAQDAFSVRVGYEGGHGFEESITGLSYPVTENIDPQLLSVGLDYYHYFQSGPTRFFLVGGLLFGQSFVNFYSDDPAQTISGVLTGNGVGFEAGLGADWALSPDVGLGISGRFRYLTVSPVENNYILTNTGTTGKLGLVVTPYGTLALDDTASMGQDGSRFAVLDYTGFTLQTSLYCYLF